MAYNVKSSVGNYVRSVHYGVVDSAGLLIGSTATAPAAGNQTGSSLAQLLGVQNFPFQVVEPDRPTQKGDGGALVRFVNRPTDLPSSDPTFGAHDRTFAALVQSMKTRDIGGLSGAPVQPYSPTFRDMFFIVQGPAVSEDSASLDAAIWEGTMIFKAQCMPRGRDGYKTDGLPSYAYALTANYATQFPWGDDFTVLLDGDTKMVAWDFTAPYQVMVQHWVGNNTETVFNLSHTLAEDSANNIMVWSPGGTALTWIASGATGSQFSADIATNAITLGTAPGASADLFAVYGFLGS